MMDFKELVLMLLFRLVGEFANEALAIAIVAAQKIADDPAIITNAERRKALIHQLKSQMPKVKESVLNLLAEIAVQVIKQNSLAEST
ncbi:MAG: hypothetical protein AB1847_11210 [bacterium]